MRNNIEAHWLSLKASVRLPSTTSGYSAEQSMAVPDLGDWSGSIA